MSGIVNAVMGVVSSIFGGGDKPQAPAPIAAPEPVQVIPTMNTAEVEAARKRSLLKQTAAGGRASTILSGSDDKLGG